MSHDVVPQSQITPGAIRALAARYKFQQTRLEEASAEGNEKVMKMAMTGMAKIEEEAAGLGTTVEQLLNVPTNGAVVTNNKLTNTNPPAKVGKVPQSVADSQKLADRARAIAAEKAAGGQIPGSTRTAKKKNKGEVKMRPCLDGCGTEVPGNFKMGHDAKLKSMILKIERGELGLDAVPEIAQDLLKFKRGEKVENRDSKGKVISSVQEMICTAAPVKIPGRADVQLTVRSD